MKHKISSFKLCPSIGFLSLLDLPDGFPCIHGPLFSRAWAWGSRVVKACRPRDDSSSQGLCPASSLLDRCMGMTWDVDFVRQVRFGIVVMADRSLFLFVPTYDALFLGDAWTDEFLIAAMRTGKGGCSYGNVSAGVVKQLCVHCKFIVTCSME